MPRFKTYNYYQNAKVVINYQDQLQPGTFEHAVHILIKHKIDLTVFHPRRCAYSGIMSWQGFV
ncbi:hypothetical protein HVA01_29470 [Halovibrio variabilis]|uniref:Uncharacterized protein n=1 Tax=Halovibrio variabilis TaxID=31910 RepID=A0A511UTM4_9GAMM|nr:transposase [Halovibrio variabilis]GEN29301.1 hypothetical protein HVA01_29470 [Halovibrio variabilis]